MATTMGSPSSNPNEWISWDDLFGEVRKTGTSSQKQYKKNRKKHWPIAPDRFYKDEWKSWKDLFGR